ncbi:hypothetical protein D7V97_08035 [Corallococcus sp. CA053C]|nr:hypothetical protein D7V97_08035 [Corallococcus sp. CA053C]
MPRSCSSFSDPVHHFPACRLIPFAGQSGPSMRKKPAPLNEAPLGVSRESRSWPVEMPAQRTTRIALTHFGSRKVNMTIPRQFPRLAAALLLSLAACNAQPEDSSQSSTTADLLASNTWSSAGSMNIRRSGADATLLPSGDVLVTGGRTTNPPTYTSATEIYYPATNSWSPDAPLAQAREFTTATLLPSGKVLVTGGLSISGGVTNRFSSVEVYDPATRSWSSAAPMANARSLHTATLLSSGKVLVAGGNGSPSYLASAELYDPATNSWSPAGTMINARARHTATLLSSGKVLVAAGFDQASAYSASAELYDPATNSWSPAGTMVRPRIAHDATLLPSGKVLVTGGFYGVSSTPVYVSIAEVYEPAINTWYSVAPMPTGRASHTATLLSSGKVLVAGGNNASAYLSSAVMYEPATNSWTAVASLPAARAGHTATLLSSGQVLVSGGYQSASAMLSSSVLYTP